MAASGVDQAVLVSANIKNNPGNNEYVAKQVRRYPEQLHQFADVDSFWSASYHTPGAAERLKDAAARYPMKGFTHYLKAEDDGSWLYSGEGLRFFEVATDLKLIASLSCYPHQQVAVGKAAQCNPAVPILIHHLGHPKVAHKAQLEQVIAAAQYPNIYLKLSGFYYATAGPKWDFPYRDTFHTVHALFDAYGEKRLCWGSDYPVARQFMTYQQTIEAFRTHCNFIPVASREMVMGKNMAHLLSVNH